MSELLTKIVTSGFHLARDAGPLGSVNEQIMAMVDVRNCVIIVTDMGIYRAEEVDGPLGFSVRKVAPSY